MRFAPLFILLFIGCARSQDPVYKDWVSFELGQPALRMQLPGPVVAKEAQVNPETIQILKRYDTYQYLHPSNMLMGIFQFAQHTQPMVVTPSEALMTGMSKMFNSMNSTDAAFETEEVIYLYRQGAKGTGSFTYNGKPWQFVSIVVIHNETMWQLWMAAEKSTTEYTAMLDNIVRSIAFTE
jgi:hypothetical protein